MSEDKTKKPFKKFDKDREVKFIHPNKTVLQERLDNLDRKFSAAREALRHAINGTRPRTMMSDHFKY